MTIRQQLFFFKIKCVASLVAVSAIVYALTQGAAR